MLRLILVAAFVISLVVDQAISNAHSTDNSQLADNATLQNGQSDLKENNATSASYGYTHRVLQWNYFANMTNENLELLMGEPIEKLYGPNNNQGLYANIMLSVVQMVKIYNAATICDYKKRNKCDLAIETEIDEILMNSRNPEELKYIWLEWMKAVGKKVKPLYPKYIESVDLGAKSYNLSDYFEIWLEEYGTDNFMEQIENLWEQVKPVYLQLHAYVRRELRKKYGEKIVSRNGPIPVHLLGSMWGHSWANIADFTLPYPGKPIPNVNAALVEQGYNATSIFRLAESFFLSINLSALPDTFWEKSILTKQKDVVMTCYPAAWNFGDGKDFRIMYCTRINMESLLTAHHEVGHVEYDIQYKDLPANFQSSPNPAFHEAIGDAIALSVWTPSHLKKIGLLQNDLTDPEAVLNDLYAKALYKIPLLAFTYMLAQWHRGVFQGKITPDNYNCDWWSIVEKYQGLEPPVDRSEEDFDPGTVFNVVMHLDSIRYFVSYVIQFQFHKALCIEAKQYDPKNPDAKPLHQCDISGNKDAGNLLKSMLQMGASIPWPDAMEMITKQRQMDLSDLLEYFKPVIDKITEENKRTNEYIGWLPTTKKCVKTKEGLRVIEQASK